MLFPVVWLAKPDHVEWARVVEVMGLRFAVAADRARLLGKCSGSNGYVDRLPRLIFLWIKFSLTTVSCSLRFFASLRLAIGFDAFGRRFRFPTVHLAVIVVSAFFVSSIICSPACSLPNSRALRRTIFRLAVGAEKSLAADCAVEMSRRTCPARASHGATPLPAVRGSAVAAASRPHAISHPPVRRQRV